MVYYNIINVLLQNYIDHDSTPVSFQLIMQYIMSIVLQYSW